MTHSELNESMQQAARQRASKHPYSPSSASTASSSSTSVFSADGQSSQSSAPSSEKSVSLSWDGEARSASENACPAAQAQRSKANASKNCLANTAPSHHQKPTAVGNVIPPEHRVHPRRTQPAARPDCKAAGLTDSRQPPSLIRQCDRKDNFVESLVDTTSQMIEVIWPLSMVPCGRDSFGGKNLIGLRLFIQEVLRRSKTSYSTLQVALYYLVLIKPCIPKVDFTKEQLEDSHTARAMQCGRRMFLAALILASKYLQDRTYSARAWSKISGLSTAEINSNEMAFVTAVNWKLHIPEPLFQRWTDIVLKYSSSSASQTQRTGSKPSWRCIIAQLTPALDTLDVADARPRCEKKSPVLTMSPPPAIPKYPSNAAATLARNSMLAAPKPEALEPSFSVSKEQYKFPPISPKITQLPTPQMTPNSSAFCTPAVSAKALYSERSMSRAMRHAQSLSMLRCTRDTWPCPSASVPQPKIHMPSCRRTVFVPPSSLVSSPESMVSDASSQSSRSSRSSSISSVASCAGALPQPRRLAVQATRRCVNMQMMQGKRDPLVAVRSVSPANDMWSSSNPFSGTAEVSYLRGQSEESEAAAAVALQDLALAGADRKSCTRSISPASSLRKRERPTSEVDNLLQEEIQELLKRENTSSLSDNPFAAKDSEVAKTFLLGGNRHLALAEGVDPFVVAAHGSQSGSRKRLCCMEGS